MYARVIAARIRPGQLDELIAWYRAALLPAAREQPGFRGALLLTDPAGAAGLSLTLWASEAELEASVASEYLREQLAAVWPLFAGPPWVETYAVSAQDAAAPAAPDISAQATAAPAAGGSRSPAAGDTLLDIPLLAPPEERGQAR